MYFNYHATAKRLIREGKLNSLYIVEKHNDISPALILCFDDLKHPFMPIRENHWKEYFEFIEKNSKYNYKELSRIDKR